MRRAPRQLSFADRPIWGGKRKGAGRPRVNPRRCVPHRRRAEHRRYNPVHLTLHARGGLPSLRAERVFARLRDALVAHGASKTRLRVVHFSVQADHVHLVVAELETPRQVRHALVHVLFNFKKHDPYSRGLDPRSSAGVFDGWQRPPAPPSDPLPLLPPRTWLLRRGWRRHGLLGPAETPAPR